MFERLLISCTCICIQYDRLVQFICLLVRLLEQAAERPAGPANLNRVYQGLQTPAMVPALVYRRLSRRLRESVDVYNYVCAAL